MSLGPSGSGFIPGELVGPLGSHSPYLEGLGTGVSFLLSEPWVVEFSQLLPLLRP